MGRPLPGSVSLAITGRLSSPAAATLHAEGRGREEPRVFAEKVKERPQKELEGAGYPA